MIHSIYKFVNQINGKVYIGYTIHPERRMYEHENKSKFSNLAFHQAIKKYGINNFTFEIIYQSLDGKHCQNIMEEYFIREYHSHVDEGFGYNMTYGGEGQKNPTIETRWKIGSANRGKKRKPQSEETKLKIGLANSKKKRTKEEKEHLRQINIGKKHSKESIEKRSKTYIVTDPSGSLSEIKNLNQFCKENNLNQGAMSAMARGKGITHKGWSVKFK
jgi:group I intron endonuclease